MTGSSVRLVIQGVSHCFDGLQVLDGIDLVAEPGRVLVLVGPSGCGKSTLLGIAGGLIAPSAGVVTMAGRVAPDCLNPLTPVFQDFALLPWRSVAGNVSLVLEGRMDRHARTARVNEVLALTGLSDFADAWPRQLSGGMRQRVGIARAFALSPKLLLLDEPFGMLDSLTRWELQEVLMEVWSRTKVTAICVTHDVDEAILLADRVVMMTNGPHATIGKITEVKLPRPRTRRALLDHPDYYHDRAEVLAFLEEYEHEHRPKAVA
ncbi:MAG: ABC transporter ATP-binding protein [Gemmatimonadaceae bacterium]|nr:ABC transporter ATP-binding protein [Acetobacteraceae bacterium]